MLNRGHFNSSFFIFNCARKALQPAAAPGRRAALSRSAGPLVQARPLGCGLALSGTGPSGPSGPQPPGGGGPQFVPELASTPQAASRIGWLDGCRSFAPRRPAFRVRKSARACASQTPVRIYSVLNCLATQSRCFRYSCSSSSSPARSRITTEAQPMPKRAGM